MAKISSPEIATTMKATRRAGAEIVHREALLPDLEGEQRRGGPGPAAGHRVDEVIAREGDQRVVDEEDDDDRFDVREDDVGEALETRRAVDRRRLDESPG